jgi:riboflavin kinase/FMN adenylyltransferase
MCLPALGIYAGFYERPDGTVHPTAISVGRRPTFYENGDVLIEAFLLDASFDLYGEAARVSFVERLRSEVAFDSVDDLVAQMAKDVESTRVALGLLA